MSLTREQIFDLEPKPFADSYNVYVNIYKLTEIFIFGWNILI